LVYEKLIRDVIILWATIDPISTLLVFVAVTANLEPKERKRIALRATLWAALVLIGSIIAGQILLAAMGIRMVSFQVAGGIVLFLFALQLIFGQLLEKSWERMDAGDDVAVFPLALPTIATPGAILAVIVLTDNRLYSLALQAGTTAITLLILAITYVMMRSADRILGVLGKQGALMLVRVMGLILAALSVQVVFDAVGFASF
jgi:multiple antibiotic resistance protein